MNHIEECICMLQNRVYAIVGFRILGGMLSLLSKHRCCNKGAGLELLRVLHCVENAVSDNVNRDGDSCSRALHLVRDGSGISELGGFMPSSRDCMKAPLFTRGFSFHARGRPKREIIRNDPDDQFEDADDEGLRFDPSQVVPSDDEDDSDPDSLVMRLEDKEEPVLPILHQWIAEGKETHDGVIAAMKRLKWLGRYKHAFEISDWVMKERRLELQKFHWMNHLELLGRVVSMKAAELFHKKMPPQYHKSESAYVTLFDNYITHEAMFKAKTLLTVMKRNGHLTTPFVFNRLFALCSKMNKEDRVPMVLRDMKQLCISPDIDTYNILIGMKAKKGDTDGMERLFSKMKCDGDGTPNGTIFCTLASGYVNACMPEKAAEYLKEVVGDVEFKQSRKTHDKVISLYAAIGNVKEVDRIWRFSRKFPVISANSYISAIAAYEKLGQIDKAEMVFQELSEKKALLRARHYNALFQAYSESGQMRKAEKLVERMWHNNCRLNNMSYHHLVTGYLKSGNQKMAVETLKKMLNQRVRPSFETMLLVLKFHGEEGDVASAEALFQDMRRECYTRNIQAYNALLQAYVKAEKHAYRFLQRMALDKVAPNAATFLMLNEMKPIPKLSEETQLSALT